MRLKELRLNHFGKFHNTTLELKDGINLIYGDNEAGKTTIHSFIRGMLFGIERLRGRASKDDPYLKYQPWDSPGAYSGSMDFEVGGKTYRILRNFDKNTKGYSLIDIETGRELNLQPENMKELYGGLTESGYRNTISIEQLKSRTDYELVEEVRNYITNLSLSKSNEIDITEALSYLQDKKKQLESQQVEEKIAQLEKQIEEGLAREAVMDSLTLQLKEIGEHEKLLYKRKMTDEVLEKMEGFSNIEEYNTSIEQFPAIKEKYKNYSETVKQIQDQKQKQMNLQYQMRELEQTQIENIHIKNQMDELDKIKAKMLEVDANQNNQWETTTNLQKDSRRYIIICLTLTIVISILLLSFLGFNSKSYMTIIGVAAASQFLYLFLSKESRQKIAAFKKELEENDRIKSSLQGKVQLMLSKSDVADEVELNNKYNGVLRQILSMEHYQKELMDSREQAALLDTKRRKLQEEILVYISRYSDAFSTKDFGTDTLNETTMVLLEEYIIRQKQQITHKQEELTKENENILIKKEKIRWELDALEGNEGELLRNKELYNNKVAQKKENELELSAIKLAVDTLNDLSVDIHNSFGKELNHLVSGLTSRITKGKYEDVKIDEKLNIKVGYEDNYVKLDNLSAGTMGQLYFALRLGISDLVYGQGAMPILLDDCFALYDDTRTKAALETLIQREKSQILIFTCHNREKTMLEEMHLDYNYIDLRKLS